MKKILSVSLVFGCSVIFFGYIGLLVYLALNDADLLLPHMLFMVLPMFYFLYTAIQGNGVGKFPLPKMVKKEKNQRKNG